MNEKHLKELMLVIEGTLEELKSRKEDSDSGAITSKILSTSDKRISENVDMIERLSLSIVNSWRKDNYDRQCKVKALATDELLNLHNSCKESDSRCTNAI
ncbi:hypothetical protein UT300012_22860 [Paraclostridium bifermentans]